MRWPYGDCVVWGLAMAETLRFYRRHLPHWLVADHTYFVTIRQKGTLPADVVKELQQEREKLLSTPHAGDDVLALLRKQFVRVERILHSPTQVGVLTNPAIATILVENLAWLESDSRGWNVYAAVVMSTHMHIVLRNEKGRSSELLSDIGLYKSFTAREANKVRGCKGSLWAREEFDHWCSSQESVVKAVRYVKENPVKAGLCRDWQEWPWTRVGCEWS